MYSNRPSFKEMIEFQTNKSILEKQTRYNEIQEKQDASLFVGDQPEKSENDREIPLTSANVSGIKPRKRSNEGYGPPKKAPRKGRKLVTTKTLDSRTSHFNAEWYDSIDVNQTYPRSDLYSLKNFGKLLEKAEKSAGSLQEMHQIFARIRSRLQDLSLCDFISAVLIKKTHLIEPGAQSLPTIFDNQLRDVNFPYDLQADAKMLYLRWATGNIDPHLLRGIVSKQGQNAQQRSFRSHSIEANYKFKISSKYLGEGDLINGQWWPLQVCAVRDGGHGEIEGGIHGEKGKGAYSIVLSGGGYKNEDSGDTIKYCGTLGTNDSPSTATKYMITAYSNQQPIRVLRSSGLPAGNPYRPAKGLRYDGLYVIDAYDILDADTSMHRFNLRRLSGQDPIRNQGEGARPSKEELDEFRKVMEMLGRGV